MYLSGGGFVVCSASGLITPGVVCVCVCVREPLWENISQTVGNLTGCTH